MGDSESDENPYTLDTLGFNPFLLLGPPRMFREPYPPSISPSTLFKDTPASTKSILETSANPRETFERISAIVFMAKRGGWDHVGYEYLISPNATKEDKTKIKAAYRRLDRKWRTEAGCWLSMIVQEIRDDFHPLKLDQATTQQREELWTEMFCDNPAAIAFKCFGSKAVDVDFMQIFDPTKLPGRNSITGRWRTRFLQVFVSGCELAYKARVKGDNSGEAIKINCGLWLTFHPNRNFCNLNDLPIKWQETVDWDEYEPCLCPRRSPTDGDAATIDRCIGAEYEDSDMGEDD